MPRTYPPARKLTAIRISYEGLAEIDRLAAGEGVKQAEMIRRLLAEAVAVRLHGSRRGNPHSATRTEKPTSTGV